MYASPLNSDQLEAFEAVARLANFTSAASELHLTQPALSRRIRALEDHLRTSLFLRKPSGVELTDAGLRLLRFVETKGLLENELKADLHQSTSRELVGLVRIAGYSSILHEVVTPSIGTFLRENPKIGVHYLATQDVKPVARQSELLLRAEIDLLLSTTNLGTRDIVSETLGEQELIAVESTRFPTRSEMYIDTRPDDSCTAEFFKSQRIPLPKHQRSFLYDEYGILKAVMQGMGRAVVFRSLVKKGMPLRQVRGTKTLRWQIYLHYRKQPYYAPSFDGIRQSIVKRAGDYLA